MPGLRTLLVLAAAAGFYLSTQTPRRVIGTGLVIMLIGALAYLARGGTWRVAAELRTGSLHKEQSFERWLGQREAWLLRAVRRQP